MKKKLYEIFDLYNLARFIFIFYIVTIILYTIIKYINCYKINFLYRIPDYQQYIILDYMVGVSGNSSNSLLYLFIRSYMNNKIHFYYVYYMILN